MIVTEAVATRRSVRGFLNKPVDLCSLEKILVKAARSPSGGNLQPWHIHVVAGSRMAALRNLMPKRLAAAPSGEPPQYPIYPTALASPYRERRYAVGEDLYGALGISRDDKAARTRWFSRNFAFFGAPIGLFCFVDRSHGAPQWSDCGMYLQTVMLLLREIGLDSCPQECWALYPETIATFLDTPPEHMLFTGMAIGWADETDPANAMRSDRAPAGEVIHFHLD